METFTVETLGATKLDVPFTAQPVGERKRTLHIGNTLTRKRKGYPNEPPYPWAIARDVITAPRAADTSEYVAALCEGIGECAGGWFIYRAYFTNNRHGNRHFGQNCPQVPLSIDKWLNEQILKRGWYGKVTP